MLIIRKEQLRVFEQSSRQKFEDQMVAHIQKFAPRISKILGKSIVREIVGLGMGRAETYGFTNRGPVRFYIEMMFMFGSFFDTDPQYPWAAEILNAAEEQMTRADHLFDSAMDCIEKVAGPKNQFEKAALQKLLQIRPAEVLRPNEDLHYIIVSYLNRVHPEKCAYIGEAVLKSLIPSATTQAQKHQIDNQFGISLIVGLMFAFGHACTTDPQFPWIGGTLNNPAIGVPEKRIERLYSKMRTYFENALAVL